MSVFDEYRGEQIGEGKKSLAFRTAYGSPERTLTDEEAAAVRSRIVEALAERFGASCAHEQSGPRRPVSAAWGSGSSSRWWRSRCSGGGAARADNPVLTGDVGAGDAFTITLNDATRRTR